MADRVAASPIAAADRPPGTYTRPAEYEGMIREKDVAVPMRDGDKLSWAQFAGMYISTWNQLPTNKKVGVMYPNDADGNAIRGFRPDAFKAAGFTAVDPGPFEDMTTDYSAQVALFKKEKCEIINALVLPPDFATFWRQAAQQGFAKSVKIIQPAKAGSAPSEIEALGEVGYNVAGGGPWNRAFP